MKTIKLPVLGIEVTLTGDGGGSITSDLQDCCPHCEQFDCHFSCDMSQAEFAEPEDDIKESEEDVESRIHYNLACDGVEAVILGHAVAGIDIESPAYLEGIETAIQAIGNNV